MRETNTRRNMIFALLIILSGAVVISENYAQLPDERDIRVVKCGGQVFYKRGGIQGQLNEVRKDIRLLIGDEIITGPDSYVKVRINVPSDGRVEYTLRANSKVTVKGLCLLSDLEGAIEVKADIRKARYSIHTASENIATSGTDFLVTTRPEVGTIVDVLGGQVELEREGEALGIEVTGDCKASIPTGKPLKIISSRPLYQKIALGLITPGTNRLMRGISTAALVGFLVYNEKRMGAARIAMDEYIDYSQEINPSVTAKLYDRYYQSIHDAKKYRNYQIGLAVLYGSLAGYSTITTVREHTAYLRIVEDIEELEEKLQVPKLSLNVRGEMLVSKAWSF